MANPNSPFGLRPYANIWGAPYSGAARVYYVPASNATALYLGDPLVTITNSSDGNGIQTVGIAAAGGGTNVLGSFGGIAPNAGLTVIPLLQSTPAYLPALTAAYVYVTDDPFLLYQIQENGSMVSGASGRNADLVAGTGSTITGLSGWQLNSSTLATTSTLQLRIVQALQETTLAVGTNNQWLVGLNTPQFLNRTGV